MLIALILRRHLAKMHLCMTTEMNDEELFDDSYTIKFVVEAAWLRYNDLLGTRLASLGTLVPIDRFRVLQTSANHRHEAEFRLVFVWSSEVYFFELFLSSNSFPFSVSQ